MPRNRRSYLPVVLLLIAVSLPLIALLPAASAQTSTTTTALGTSTITPASGSCPGSTAVASGLGAVPASDRLPAPGLVTTLAMIGVVGAVEAVASASGARSGKQTRGKLTRTQTAAITVVIIVVAGASVYTYLSDARTTSTSTSASATVPVAQTLPVANGTFSLAGSAQKPFNFTVPAARYNIHLSGNYNVTSGSTVEVLLMDAQQWSAWNAESTNNETQTGNSSSQSNFYYDSGKMAVGSIDLTFPTTTDDCSYYVLFLNPTGGQITVTTDMTINWELSPPTT